MTNDEYDDERIDERVRALAAASYNPPQGTVPREDMWASVAAARRAERSATVLPLRPSRRTAPWRWAAALAAGLVLGVVADRLLMHTSRSTVEGTAVVPPDVTRPAPPPLPIVPPDSSRRVASGATTPEPAPRQMATLPRRAAAASVPATPRDEDSPSAPPPDARQLYQLAAVQTLVQAEALLTAYRRAEDLPRDAVAMRQAARWSRDVLSSTRLLLDSPAGGDPRFRQLLSDLELVLVQIVQLSGAPLQADERALIERTLHDRDLLPRLRSAVPAGATAS